MKRSILKIVKTMMLGILAVIVLVTLVAAVFINTSPQFGGKPNEESLARIENSTNYKDGTFQNMELTLASTGLKFSTLLKFFTTDGNKTPKGEIPVEKKSTDYYKEHLTTPRITWFGHSAVMVEIADKNILIDPMLGDVPAPHPLLATGRFNKTLPTAVDSLPKIDVVLISHDHYDHLDYGTIKKIDAKVEQYYVPLGIKAHLLRWGVADAKIKEFDWWNEISLNGIQYVATPSRHFSGRGVTDRNKTLWCSWVIKSANNSIYFSGDGGYGSHFKEIGDNYGPFDFAMVECGQYDEQWAHIHMMPEESVQAGVDVNAKLIMPIHWGAFKLALHEWDDPVVRAKKHAAALNIPMATPKIGETIDIDSGSFPKSEWWKDVY